MAFDYSKLKEDLKELFDKTNDPDILKKYAEVSNQIDAAEKESSQLVSKNGELMKMYKDVILETPTKDTSSPVNDDGEINLDKIFSEALAKSN